MKDFHKTCKGSFESFFNEFTKRTIQSIIGLLFFKFYLNLKQVFGGIQFSLILICTALTFFIEKIQTFFFLIEHEKLLKIKTWPLVQDLYFYCSVHLKYGLNLLIFKLDQFFLTKNSHFQSIFYFRNHLVFIFRQP